MVSNLIADYAEISCQALHPQDVERKVIEKLVPVNMILKGVEKSEQFSMVAAPSAILIIEGSP